METQDLPGVALAPGMDVEKEDVKKSEDPRPAPSEHLAEHIHTKNVKHRQEFLPRHPMRGYASPGKKEGHGGKFTWEGPTPKDYNAEEDYVPALDEHDPNYVDPKEEERDAEAAVGSVDVPKLAEQGVARVDVKLQPQ